MNYSNLIQEIDALEHVIVNAFQMDAVLLREALQHTGINNIRDFMMLSPVEIKNLTMKNPNDNKGRTPIRRGLKNQIIIYQSYILYLHRDNLFKSHYEITIDGFMDYHLLIMPNQPFKLPPPLYVFTSTYDRYEGVVYDKNGKPLVEFDSWGIPITAYPRHKELELDNSGRPLVYYNDLGRPIRYGASGKLAFKNCKPETRLSDTSTSKVSNDSELIGTIPNDDTSALDISNCDDRFNDSALYHMECISDNGKNHSKVHPCRTIDRINDNTKTAKLLTSSTVSVLSDAADVLTFQDEHRPLSDLIATNGASEATNSTVVTVEGDTAQDNSTNVSTYATIESTNVPSSPAIATTTVENAVQDFKENVVHESLTHFQDSSQNQNLFNQDDIAIDGEKGTEDPDSSPTCEPPTYNIGSHSNKYNEGQPCGEIIFLEQQKMIDLRMFINELKCTSIKHVDTKRKEEFQVPIVAADPENDQNYSRQCTENSSLSPIKIRLLEQFENEHEEEEIIFYDEKLANADQMVDPNLFLIHDTTHVFIASPGIECNDQAKHKAMVETAEKVIEDDKTTSYIAQTLATMSLEQEYATYILSAADHRKYSPQPIIQDRGTDMMSAQLDHKADHRLRKYVRWKRKMSKSFLSTSQDSEFITSCFQQTKSVTP